jgi:hypothetical protein
VLAFGAKKAAEGAVKTGFRAKVANVSASLIAKNFPKWLATGISWPVGLALFILPHAWGAVKSVFGLASSVLGAGKNAIAGYFQSALNAPPAKQAWADKNPALVIVLIAIGAVAIPTMMMIGGVVPGGLQNVGAGPGGPTVPGAPEGTAVAWSYPGDPPLVTAPFGIPVVGGGCSQGPGGSFSHKGIKAYDLTGGVGADVKATHDAYVVSFHDGIAANTFINHSYGNYVLLVGKRPDKQIFFTMYGHLLSVTPIVAAAINGGRPACNGKNADICICKNNDPLLICSGEVIGAEDATGSTYGNCLESVGAKCVRWSPGVHLHYQYQGPGELVLPFVCR